MFKKLKDKIAEEVKQSPLKSVQQLAQAVVSPTSSSVFEPSSSNDKFCIEEGDIEEDEKQEQARPGGFTSVTLTGQMTSPTREPNQKYNIRSSAGSLMAEADNLFPKFEPQPTNFHVQSDWESASEVEDRYSQLDHITKESLYEAYRKVYNRYNKIKNKYHEVVTHYRQLEREKERAKTVLTETQDKALLRISELREQCLLEQQAKAHLEEALRNELEERDHIINTLKTKVQYLKGSSENSAAEGLDKTHLPKEEGNLIDFTENLSVSKVPLPFDASSSEETINWFEEKLKHFKNILNEETGKVEQLKLKLEGARNQSHEVEDASLETSDNIGIAGKELHHTLTNLISRLTLEVNYLQKNTVSCPQLEGGENVQPKLSGESIEESKLQHREYKSIESSDPSNGFNIAIPSKVSLDAQSVSDLQSDEISRYCASIKELKEQNKTLIQRLEERNISLKELKNEINSLSTVTDVLKTKLKLTNENFRKSYAISCLITDQDHELIHEWNLCFENFIQVRSELVKLENIKEDLEKELNRIKDEKNALDNSNREISENNNKLNEELKSLKNYIKSNLAQVESLSTEISDLKEANSSLKQIINDLEESLANSEKVSDERQHALQQASSNYCGEKSEIETRISSLESELEKAKSEHVLLLKTKDELNAELLSLKKENGNITVEKECLNVRVNELENKNKQIEEDYKSIIDVKDRLDNEINLLTKKNEELVAEKTDFQSKIANLEKDLETSKLNHSLLLEEKENLLKEIVCIKEENDILNREKLSTSMQYDNLVKNVESFKRDYSKSLDEKEQLSEELLSLKRELDALASEKYAAQTKIDGMNKEIENYKKNCLLVEGMNNQLSEELVLVKTERDNLVSEKESIHDQIERLEKDSKNIYEELLLLQKVRDDLTIEKSDLLKEIFKLEENLKSNQENSLSSSEVSQKLSDELEVLKKGQDDLIKEKDILKSKIKTLEDELFTSEKKCSMISQESNKISEEIESLKKERDCLIMEKQVLQDRIEKLENDLKIKEDELLSCTEANNRISCEIEALRNKNTDLLKDNEILFEKYDNIVSELEKNQVDLTAQKAFTNIQLGQQKTVNTNLNKELHSLSESLKIKCDEVDEKCQENARLKTDIEKLVQKVEDTGCLLDKLTKDRDSLLNYFATNLTNIKVIKELQKHLYDFVMQFQVQISHELNEINTKMGHDLLNHLNNLLDPDMCSTKIIDLECRSKKDIDSYNSKLKYLHGGVNSSEDISKVKASVLESAITFGDEVSSKKRNIEEKEYLQQRTIEVDSCPTNDQKVCDPEVYLKQAILLMKSFTNLLNHNSVSSDHILRDVLEPVSNEKYIRLNESESKNFQKEIAAMESFITDYESKYNETDSSSVRYQDWEASDLRNRDNDSEMQLTREVRLKDDIIKKLHSVIEKYEQQKDGTCSDGDSNEKIFMLEQENKSLLQRLQQLQETHELNIKNIISEYEKKLEEMEEDQNLYDFEKLGKEKKHVENEMKEQIQSLQQDIEERGDAYEKLYEEHQQSMKSLDEEIYSLKTNHDKELREQDKKWRQCLDRRLAEEEARHKQELASLNMQWNAERRELETARRLAVNAVESGSSSSELLRRQIQALTMQLAELRNNRCEACDRQRQKGSGQEHRPRSIHDCTEMEYLRNILYEYMMGKEPLVLAKVLCALMKFDENQTKDIVSKEEQKITLFGQLGLL